ncbi:hypothetical protein [Ktedonobacter robiniae]|uniref:Uncharacterized protein n=1 Tax=Ktedonobacter robiniae TaxID=2778365 RepID=A0ABQ3UX90_9CHLR|nr:hypothetical protein [Ktedonobacter robiniae]GHO57279.1 hypothetical protein KSB_57540 [Ktedonobacter robiniae]
MSLILGGLLLSLLSACVGIAIRNLIYASYQPAQCTILSKQIIHDYSGDIWFEEPSLTYSARLPDGNREIATGYKGPWVRDGWKFGAQEENSDLVLQNYAIGRTYACWYTPFKSPHAVLVRANYTSDSMSVSFWRNRLLSLRHEVIPQLATKLPAMAGLLCPK